MALDHDRKYGGYVATCDNCQDHIRLSDDFHESIEDMKEQGWQIVRRIKSYNHYCGDCRIQIGSIRDLAKS